MDKSASRSPERQDHPETDLEVEYEVTLPMWNLRCGNVYQGGNTAGLDLGRRINYSPNNRRAPSTLRVGVTEKKRVGVQRTRSGD
uniref:Uncharacterized protein n=1 Tax=Timema tahoe TaxID=61484 RepID=A0A7R9FGR3_9NEOP|nr:unnamed protein product [Timema tahoe]